MEGEEKDVQTPSESAASEPADLSSGNTTLGSKDTDAVDSIGNPKEPSVKPLGLKPEPKAEVLPAIDHSTDALDSANNPIAEEHAYIPGPRGPGSQRFSPDSYRREEK